MGINMKAINKSDLITPLGGNGIFAKYENYGDVHLVYAELENQVRRVSFPTHSLAIQFMNRLLDYNKCKTENELKGIGNL